jgi:MFS transporter, DHA1 family, multidrug resistance protein
MIRKQKYFNDKGMLALLTLISAFPPLSTDLYLPALPRMQALLNTSQSRVNLTLSMFFVFYAAGLLFWGPLSEKYGRKPILLTGMVLYHLHVHHDLSCGLVLYLH